MRWKDGIVKRGKYFCPTCLDTRKNSSICGKCGNKRYLISSKARTPKRDVSIKNWTQFADLFLKQCGREEAYNKTMETLGRAQKKEEEKTQPKTEKLKHNIKFELVEFLVDTHGFVNNADLKELLRNGRGYNKWANKELVKEFEKRCMSKEYDQLHTAPLKERENLIQTLLLEREFGL